MLLSAPFLDLATWLRIKDGDDEARRLFDRHYSRYSYADGRQPKLFVGPGYKMVLTTPCRRALFVWRKFISDDGQRGINCAIFRNEGAGLSSDLIRAADAIADRHWPGERHFTYVNPRKVSSTNPGFCFIKAGWRRCGQTKARKLLILERPSPAAPSRSHAGDRPNDDASNHSPAAPLSASLPESVSAPNCEALSGFLFNPVHDREVSHP